MVDNFTNVMSQIIDQVSPVKTVKKRGLPKAPWRSSEKVNIARRVSKNWMKNGEKLIAR